MIKCIYTFWPTFLGLDVHWGFDIHVPRPTFLSHLTSDSVLGSQSGNLTGDLLYSVLKAGDWSAAGGPAHGEFDTVAWGFFKWRGGVGDQYSGTYQWKWVAIGAKHFLIFPYFDPPWWELVQDGPLWKHVDHHHLPLPVQANKQRDPGHSVLLHPGDPLEGRYIPAIAKWNTTATCKIPFQIPHLTWDFVAINQNCGDQSKL